MKRNYKLFILYFTAALAFTACSTGRQATAQKYDEYYDRNDDYDYDNRSGVDINVFVNALSPYGRWIASPSYGRVWVCNEPGFTPYYTRGHWMYTTYGWTWASDYSWGWAPFHYGRWAYDPFYGWMWVPGYQWGPAWVGWRSGGDYYGWAPLAPGINISVGLSFGNYMPADRWCFVPRRYMASPHFGNYRVAPTRNVTIINNTTVINNTNIYHNTRYVTGPSRRDVERYSGERINEMRINNDNKPGNYRMVNKNTVTMYRPQIKEDIKINNHPDHGNSNSNNINLNGQSNQAGRDAEINRNNDRNYHHPEVPPNRDNNNSRDGKRKDNQPPQDNHNMNNDNYNRNIDPRRDDARDNDFKRNNNAPDYNGKRQPVTTRDYPPVNRDNNGKPPADWSNRQPNNMPQYQPGTRSTTKPPVHINNDRYRTQDNNQPQYRQAPAPQSQQQNGKRRKD